MTVRTRWWKVRRRFVRPIGPACYFGAHHACRTADCTCPHHYRETG